MGKKSSSSSPAVDPSVGVAMQKQADIAERQQYWYENEMYPWLKQQTELQNTYSEADRAMAQQNYTFWQNYATDQSARLNAMSDEFYNRWKDQYRPIEDSLIADAKNYNTSAEAERQAQAAIGDYSTAYATQRQALNQQMQAYGINPTSGAYLAQNRALSLNEASAKAAAANQARQYANELGWNKKYQISALGQNYVNSSMNAAATGSNIASSAGSLANNSLAQSNTFGQQGTQNITNLANVGLNSYQSLSNAWGQYGQLGMSVSNYNQNAWNLNQQQSAQQAAGVGQMVGTVASVAAVAI